MNQKNEFFCHLMTGEHHQRGITIAAYVDRVANEPTLLKLGIATKNPDDINYRKKLGRLIAMWRAHTHPYKSIVVNEDNIVDTFKSEIVFIDSLFPMEKMDTKSTYFRMKHLGMLEGKVSDSLFVI